MNSELELVLVEDNNDFVDPLELNFECEEINEDNKLQLNDDIYEEKNFFIGSDDDSCELIIETGNRLSDSNKCNKTLIESHPVNSNRGLKIDIQQTDSDDDSFDFDNGCDESDSSILFNKPKTNELSENAEEVIADDEKPKVDLDKYPSIFETEEKTKANQKKKKVLKHKKDYRKLQKQYEEQVSH